MPKRSNEGLIKILLFFAGALLGFFSFIYYNIYSKFEGYILLFLSFVVFIAIYGIVQYKFINDLKYFIRDFDDNVKLFVKGLKPNYSLKNLSPEVKNLYEKLENYQEHILTAMKIKDGSFEIINTLSSTLELNPLLEKLLPVVIEKTESNWAAFYVFNESTEKFELETSIGFSKNIYQDFDIVPDEGFAGMSIKMDRIEIINDIPDDTNFVTRTFLGTIKPKAIMSVPISHDGRFLACLLLASIQNYKKENLAIIKKVSTHFAVTLNNCNQFDSVKRIKNEYEFQHKLIHELNEELEEKVAVRTSYLNSIIDSITDYSIISFDKNGFITAWNKGAELLIGYTKEESVGYSYSDIFNSSDNSIESQFYSWATTAVKDGRSEHSIWLPKKDGSKFYASIVLTPIFDENHNHEGFAGIIKLNEKDV